MSLHQDQAAPNNDKAVAIDMETSALYQTAWVLNFRAISIRGISNCLNPDGTDDNIHLSDITGSCRAACEVLFGLLDKLNEQEVRKSNIALSQSNNTH